MIRRFEKINGRYPELIRGQSRLAYSLSTSEDFYDMPAIIANGGHQGTVISFYDLADGKVFTPFEKKKNVIYGRPLYCNEKYCFLQGDFNDGKIRLYSWIPGKEPKLLHVLDIENTDLYNLGLAGNELHIVAQNSERLISYWPESFSIPLDPHESLEFIDNERIYLSSWVEEGWDETNGCASFDYRYYEKTVVKDKRERLVCRDRFPLSG